MAGVINTEDSLRFKRILFRVTRNMAWTTLVDITKPKKELDVDDISNLVDDETESSKPKTVFFIVYQAGSFEMMKNKLTKLCDSFGASK